MKTYTIIGGVNGKLSVKGDVQPAWLKEFRDFL